MDRSTQWGSSSRILVIALAAFTASTAIGGAALLLLFPGGSAYVPLRLLQYSPFTSFLVPALLLGIVVGGTSLACAALAWRRSRAAFDAAILAGGALTAGIVAELAMTRSLHPLHFLYGAIGVLLLGHGLRAAWGSGAPRHRWTITVTAAEWLGFLVPLSIAMITVPSDLSDLAKVELVVAAGLVEGFVLGFGQAYAFPLRVHRLRYATYTSLAAGLVWLVAMVAMLLGQSDRAPVGLVAAVLLVGVLVALTAIGVAQWFELRHFTPAAPEWIGWTALAWALALPLSFAPGPFVDESTPISSVVALWATAGLVMAHVMARITWIGAERLTSKHTGLYEEHPSVRRPTASLFPTS
jgi:hypothetical protein